MQTPKLPPVQVYAQMMPRLNTHVLGDRLALLALRAAIDEALTGSEEKVGLARVSDRTGEPYTIIVAQIAPESMAVLPSHCTDASYREPDFDFTRLDRVTSITRRLFRERRKHEQAAEIERRARKSQSTG